MDEPGAFVHGTNPFADPESERTPARRLRGRLASPVTVWTAGPPQARAGMTVSSLMVADGTPALILGLIGDLSDLLEAATGTGRFVVHILEQRHRGLAERFSGAWPSPGGAFAGLEVEATRWGPVLRDVPNRAMCSLAEAVPAGYARLVTGTVDEVALGDLEEPLMHFRGRYPPGPGLEAR